MSRKTPVHKKKWIQYVSVRRSKWWFARMFMWWHRPKIVDVYYNRYGHDMLERLNVGPIFELKCRSVKFRYLRDMLTFRMYFTRMKG